MPSRRPRLTITDSGAVAEALDEAASHWPEVRSRRELLLRLIERGRRAIAQDEADARERRKNAIERVRGSMTGVYQPSYREDLRDEWPA
jgi:hypothetical protein